MIEDFKFPIVKNVNPKLLGDDIVPFIPGNEENMKMWDEQMKLFFKSLRDDFNKKGVPFPKIVIDSTPGPITYAIKTVDGDGNTLHSQP